MSHGKECSLLYDLQETQLHRLPPAGLDVWVLDFNEEKYLDPSNMTIKTRTVPNFTSQDIAEGWIDYTREVGVGFNSFKIIRNNETTLGAGKYPAWRVDALTGQGPDQNYHSVIYSVFNNRIYGLESSMVSLVAPEYLPIIEKIVDSFQTTQAGNTTGKGVSPEPDCKGQNHKPRI
jgi:hypothetical protein